MFYILHTLKKYILLQKCEKFSSLYFDNLISWFYLYRWWRNDFQFATSLLQREHFVIDAQPFTALGRKVGRSLTAIGLPQLSLKQVCASFPLSGGVVAVERCDQRRGFSSIAHFGNRGETTRNHPPVASPARGKGLRASTAPFTRRNVDVVGRRRRLLTRRFRVGSVLGATWAITARLPQLYCYRLCLNGLLVALCTLRLLAFANGDTAARIACFVSYTLTKLIWSS